VEKGVFLQTMGCRLNQYDGAALSCRLAGDGWVVVGSAREADLVVLNSCTVTDAADREVWKLLRRFRAEAPGALIAVTGCLAQRDPERVASHPEVDLVIGMAEKRKAAEIVRAFEEEPSFGRIHVGSLDAIRDLFLEPVGRTPGKSRVFLKVQEGCDRSCSYCIVPQTRGRERSVPAATVVAEIRRLAALEVPEVVLTGVHIGGWGADFSPPRSFVDLLGEVDRIPESVRIRISSLEPMEQDERLVRFLAGARHFVPHLHLPLQSGSDRVLADMRRGHTAGEYLDFTERLVAAVPRLRIGTDLIVGFPTEEEREFEETMAFVERSPLSHLHVFPFSPREGTEAARLPSLPGEVVRERSRRLRELAATKARAFAERFVGSVLPVLAMTRREDGSVEGQSDNFLPVRVPKEEAAELPLGCWVDLLVSQADEEGLVAKPPTGAGS
jgi:threonylcarbamoyladenosine tRNA methylthiotransferase MtaB